MLLFLVVLYVNFQPFFRMILKQLKFTSQIINCSLEVKILAFIHGFLEGNYPDTDRLIPTDFNNIITFDTNNLRYAMERARLLSNATQNGTVKLEIINGVLVHHVNSPEVGRVNEEIDTESISGQDLTISFNPTYLIDSLKAIDSEKVTISFISAVRPFTLVPNDDAENFIQLITPVRTN